MLDDFDGNTLLMCNSQFDIIGEDILLPDYFQTMNEMWLVIYVPEWLFATSGLKSLT